MGEQKKEVCRTLTNVLRRSPLAEDIDPKSFFLMLNNNFNVLFHHNTLDLRPVWDAMAASDAPPILYGLFLAFRNSAAESGFAVDLPAVVSALPEEAQANYLALLGMNGEAMASFVEMNDEELYRTDPNAVAIPLSLGSDDLKPFIPDDMRRQIVQIVVQSLKVAPIGARLDSAQLAFLVDSNFEDLCDGRSFDFEPIMGGLRQLDGVKDTDVYVGVVKLEGELQNIGIALSPVALDVPTEAGHELLREFQLKEQREAAEAAADTARAREAPAEPSNAEELVISGDLKGTARERRLRKWGLLHLTKRQAKILRHAVLVVVLITAGSLGWLFRPNRPLDVEDYQKVFPIKQAQLRGGAFYAVVDESKWFEMPVDARKEKVAAFSVMLADEGRIPNAQIRDSTGRLVMTGIGGRKLKPAPYFLLGDRDGTIPEDRRAAVGSDAPAEARAAASKQGEPKE